MAKTKIQIKSIWGNVLFEHESEDNNIRKTVVEAVNSDANLRGADLHGANLRGANLRGVNLSDANLHGANLRGANLRGVNLRGADLHGANLRDADLRGVNLSDADLSDANLRGADLRDADLRDANLSGIVLDYNDSTDGYGDTTELLDHLRKNSNIKPRAIYENHDAFSSRWGAWWKNLIILREWSVREPETEELVSITIGQSGFSLPKSAAEQLKDALEKELK